MNEDEVQEIELRHLLDVVYERYGYDFRQYGKSTVRRRIEQRLERAGLSHISQMIPLLLHDESFFDSFLRDMSITVTEMFRDPKFFWSLRKHVIPALQSYPRIKVWHAGCASGEEVYSIAILLHEEGLLNRCQIYATDFNRNALKTAKQAIYPDSAMAQWEENYRVSGGKSRFADYFHSNHGHSILRGEFRDRVTFSFHNLCSDQSFGEMNLIFCRNVLIYFNQDLRSRVFDLFNESLCHRGFLCVGTREYFDGAETKYRFEWQEGMPGVYRRVLGVRGDTGKKKVA